MDFYKNVTREQLISSLEQFQSLHVEASNEAYRIKRMIVDLKKWVEDEMEKAELSASVQKDEYVKGLFMGQKISFERILRQIESLQKQVNQND